MEEILHHLGWCENLDKDGRNLPQLVSWPDFRLPSTVKPIDFRPFQGPCRINTFPNSPWITSQMTMDVTWVGFLSSQMPDASYMHHFCVPTCTYSKYIWYIFIQYLHIYILDIYIHISGQNITTKPPVGHLKWWIPVPLICPDETSLTGWNIPSKHDSDGKNIEVHIVWIIQKSCFGWSKWNTPVN